jgi:hypothetical protein
MDEWLGDHLKEFLFDEVGWKWSWHSRMREELEREAGEQRRNFVVVKKVACQMTMQHPSTACSGTDPLDKRLVG